MISLALPNIIRFIGLLLIQALVVNHFELSFYINPYIYPLIILAVPFATPHWALMLFAFITGLVMDAFSNTGGIHASSLVFLAFIRPAVVQILSQKGSYETTDQPTIGSLGFSWFAMYAGILIFAHHMVYFYLEIFSLSDFFSTLWKTILSSLFSLGLILLLSMLFSTGNTRR